MPAKFASSPTGASATTGSALLPFNLRKKEKTMGEVVDLFPQRVTTDEYFGGCPQCGKNNGFLNIGRGHWFVCDDHKTTWLIGSNLFSCWRDETEADWQRNDYRLAEYSNVEPIYPEPTEEDLRQRAEHEVWSAECKRIDKGFGVVSGPKGMRAIEAWENPFDDLPF